MIAKKKEGDLSLRMNIILDRFLFLYKNCHHVDSKQEKRSTKIIRKRKDALRMRRKEKN